MKNLFLKFSLCAAWFLVAAPIIAQSGSGAPPATPIDGGLSLLLAAGGIYGLKKLKDHKKSN